MDDVQCTIPYNRAMREKETGGKAIAEGINSRYSRNIGATKCKLIGKRGARGGEGKAGQRANIDALTMQANYVLVRAFVRERRWCGEATIAERARWW